MTEVTHIMPKDIEAESMRIIGEELGEIEISPEKLPIVKRVIHTSADFDYAHTLRFSKDAVERGLAALKKAVPS